MKSMLRLLPFVLALPLAGAACGAAPTVSGPAPADPPGGVVETEGLADAAYVSMGPDGFSPATITVKKGESVTWLNEDAGASHWPASAVHPRHDDYPGFDPTTPVAPGASWSFVFDRVGTWKYHDHLKPRLVGTVVVTE